MPSGWRGGCTAWASPKFRNGFEVTLHPDVLEAPLRWKKPQIIFVNSMSDLFHEQIPFDYVAQMFDIMSRAHRHIFQILTKRSKKLARINGRLPWPENVWMGVTCESQPYQFRINDLRKTGARLKFLSLEPLLGPLPNLDLSGIDWVIVGGESGPGARPMKKEWVVEILRQCRAQSVPFFFKQWGGVNKKEAGRRLNRRLYEEMPEIPQPVEMAGQAALGL